jgi:hypothetical protein
MRANPIARIRSVWGVWVYGERKGCSHVLIGDSLGLLIFHRIGLLDAGVQCLGMSRVYNRCYV